MWKKILFIVSFIIISALLFLPLSTNYLYERILDMLDKGKFIPFYKYDPFIDEAYERIVEAVKEFILNFTFEYLIQIITLIKLKDFLIILTYILQFVLIVVLIVDIWVDGENKSYKTSKAANLLIHVVEFIRKVYSWCKEFFINNKKKFILLFMLSSGFLFVVVFDFIFFLIHYIQLLVVMETHILIFEFFKWAVVFIVDFIITKPVIVTAIIVFVIYTIIAFNSAWAKLDRNWAVFKKQSNDGAVVTMYDGAPGTGKTLTLIQSALADTENMFEEIEDILVDTEISNSHINFSIVRLILKVYFGDFESSEIKDICESRPSILFDLYKLHDYITDDIVEYYFYQYYRGTSHLSTTAAVDPYWDTYTKIFEMNTMSLLKKMEKYPFEPYMTITIPEADKGNFNSHDNKKTVSEDGTYIFMGLASQLFGRHGHIRFDAQDKNQIMMRIRGVAGSYYYLYKKKVCMPVLLKLVYFPFNIIRNYLVGVIKRYLSNKPKTEDKWTLRRKQMEYKRNNVSFLYQLIKYLALLFNNICCYFEKFQFFKIYGEHAYNDQFENSTEIKYNLNVMDFDHNGMPLYNTLQFKKFYQDLKDELFTKTGIQQGLSQLDNWSSLEPTIEEFNKTGQGCYSDVINIQRNNND